MQISLNIIDILCLHIFFWICSNSRITFIVFVFICICVYVYIYIHLHVFVCVYIYVFMCVYIYIYIFCVCVCVCIYIYVYLGSISSLMQISLNIIDILCLYIFFWIRSNSRINFIVFWGIDLCIVHSCMYP